MSATAADGRKPGRGRGGHFGGPQTLIHRSKCSNPHGCSLSGRLTFPPGLVWGVPFTAFDPVLFRAVYAVAMAIHRRKEANS